MTTTSSPGALARARDAIAERADLKRAICNVCGGIVAAGRGMATDELTRWNKTPDGWRAERGLPPLRGWTRRHTPCDDPVKIVLALTGRRVSAAVAGAAILAVQPPEWILGEPAPGAIYAAACRTATAENEGWSGKAWAHVTVMAREGLVLAVSDAEREHRLKTEPHRCVNGPCGSCGVRLSLGWHVSPLKWRDGSPAPWCRDCYAVARRRPDTADQLHLRAIVLEALSGASAIDMIEYMDGFRMFAELVDPGHPGTDERWQHAAEQWAEWREDARLAWPSSLPVEIRDEYRQKVRELQTATDAERREREAAERDAERTAGGWPTA